MAATSHPLATQAALDALRVGGNALDGALAACAVQAVVEPQSTGIGGDCFCLYAPAGTGRVVAFNGSGRAPAGLTADGLADLAEIPRNSPLAVTIPGAIDAWCRLNADHGRLPLGDVLAPAIRYARDGMPVADRVAHDFAANSALLARDPATASIYLPAGGAPAVGSLLRQPQLAATLERIARQGRDGFYAGSVAADMVETLRGRGGVHTLDDFAAARGDYVEPIETTYRGLRILECPPNGQGVIALLLLNIMGGFEADPGGPLTADRMHLEIEAGQLAFAARSRHVGDPAQADIPVDTLLSAATSDALRARIDPLRAQPGPQRAPGASHRDTVYITVVDEQRNACSLINSLFDSFGSGLYAAASGVLLHNRGQGFDLDPASPNRLAPGRRPLHTIIPAMALTGDRVAMSFGVMGGQYQAFGHMQFLSRLLDFGMDIQEAMECPRYYVDPFEGDILSERRVPAAALEDLRRRGHRLRPGSHPIGGSQAIRIDWDSGVLTAGSDPRKDGQAAGF